MGTRGGPPGVVEAVFTLRRGGATVSLGVVLFIVAILVVVMVHESGHFLVAKAFGFKATKFFVGFGPTIWSAQRGETEYGVKAFPLGGFVKIIGMNPYEEVAPEDRPRSYPNKPRWQRALLLVAGSATHWVVVFALLLVAAMTIGFPTDRPSNEIIDVTTSVEGDRTPAADAGIRPGDRIVGVGGEETSSWSAIRAYIRSRAGQEAEFAVEHDGEVRTEVVPIGIGVFDEEGALVDYVPPGEDLPDVERGETTAGFLGVEPDLAYETEGLPGAVVESGKLTWRMTKGSVTSIDNVFAPVFNGDLIDAVTGERERSEQDPIGLIGIGRIAGQTVEEGAYLDFIGNIAFLTIFIGIMNLLPLPPLDGGHLAVLAYEGITRRTVDVRKLIPIAAAVISFFIVLFLAVLYLDLARPLETPF